MKKSKFSLLILAVILITVLALTLAGCTNTPAHKALISHWPDNEVATYDVTRVLADGDTDVENNPKVLGTHIITTTRINGASIQVGDKTIDNFTGTLVTITQTLDDGSYMNAKFAFSSNSRPTILYRKSFYKGYALNQPSADTTEIISSEYKGKEFIYTKTVNDQPTVDGNLSVSKDWNKTPFFDSIQLYHVARSSFTGKNDAFVTMSFAVPSIAENKIKTAKVAATNSNFELTIKEVKYATTVVSINFEQKFPGKGLPIYAWYNNAALEGAGNRMLMQFIEGNMTYILSSVTA